MSEAASSGLSGSARSGDRQTAGGDRGSARLRRGEISGEVATIAAALGVVARARGMAEVAREAGGARASLYKALSENGDPQLTTLLGVMKALGLRLTVAAGVRVESAGAVMR